MKDIFSDLYDKVLSFFTTNAPETKLVAKSRLKTVLMQDRVGFSERAMQMLKDDMLDTISRYLEINIDSFDLSIDAKDDATILNFSIPVTRTKTDEEIDEALALSHKAQIEKTQEIVGEIKELVQEKAQKLAEQIVNDENEEEVSQEENAEIEVESEIETLDKEDKEAGETDENKETEPAKEDKKPKNSSKA